jgi:hypothetical protein
MIGNLIALARLSMLSVLYNRHTRRAQPVADPSGRTAGPTAEIPPVESGASEKMPHCDDHQDVHQLQVRSNMSGNHLSTENHGTRSVETTGDQFSLT